MTKQDYHLVTNLPSYIAVGTKLLHLLEAVRTDCILSHSLWSEVAAFFTY